MGVSSLHRLSVKDLIVLHHHESNFMVFTFKLSPRALIEVCNVRWISGKGHHLCVNRTSCMTNSYLVSTAIFSK